MRVVINIITKQISKQRIFPGIQSIIIMGQFIK